MGNCLLVKRGNGNSELKYDILKQWTSGEITSVNITTSREYKAIMGGVAQTTNNTGSNPTWRDMNINGSTPTSNYFFVNGWYYTPYEGNGGASYLYIGTVEEGSTISITSNGTRTNKGFFVGLY